MFGRLICVIQSFPTSSMQWECYIAVMHYKLRAKTSIPAFMLLTHGLLRCQWTAVTTSKLLPDYNLAVLTSFVQEEKKSQLKVLVLKLQCATFHLGAQKWIPSSCLNTCHSPWWAVCPETAPHPRLRSLTAPKLPQASEKQMPKWDRGRGGK